MGFCTPPSNVILSTSLLSFGSLGLYPISSFTTCTIFARRLLVSQCKYGSWKYRLGSCAGNQPSFSLTNKAMFFSLKGSCRGNELLVCNPFRLPGEEGGFDERSWLLGPGSTGFCQKPIREIKRLDLPRGMMEHRDLMCLAWTGAPRFVQSPIFLTGRAPPEPCICPRQNSRASSFSVFPAWGS